jgi:hypothetical protein
MRYLLLTARRLLPSGLDATQPRTEHARERIRPLRTDVRDEVLVGGQVAVPQLTEGIPLLLLLTLRPSKSGEESLPQSLTEQSFATSEVCDPGSLNGGR